MYEQWGNIPAAGAVAGIGNVSGVPCMIIANDATVKAGAFFPQTAKKIIRAQRIAFECNVPLIYLVDSAGVFLPMQDEIFPDEDDFGRIFRNNSVISAAGIPQFAAIMGNCVAGGAYLPVLCDKILMTEGSGLYLAGPSLVKAAIGQVVEAEELGGAKMHAEISGTVDFYEKDDPSCLKRLRSLVALLPEAEEAKHAKKDGSHAGRQRSGRGLRHHQPRRPQAYDARDLLASIIDADSLDEYKADYGKTLVTTYARIGGRPVGIVASQRQQVAHEEGRHPDGRRDLRRQRRQSRALHHGLQPNRLADHLLPGRDRLHGRARCGAKRHHSQRREAGERGQQFHRAEDHGRRRRLVRRGQLRALRQGLRSALHPRLAELALRRHGRGAGVRHRLQCPRPRA